MNAASIVASMALAIVAVAGPDPADLVAQLGSARYAERQQAEAELERLGRKALPALHGAKDDRDPEIRARAAALADRIEGSLLTKPTMMTLDYDNRPLADVVKTMNAREDARINLLPENNPAWQVRRLTLLEPEPVPYWTAIDRLCQAGQIQYNMNIQNSLPLYEGSNGLHGPVYDTGPFRLRLTGLHWQRDTNFAAPVAQGFGPQLGPLPGGVVPQVVTPRPAPAVTEQFFATIHVAVEPRLTVQTSGTPKVFEAIDDRGQSLRPSNAAIQHRSSGYGGMHGQGMLPVQIPLTPGEFPSTSFKRLRVSIPVTLSTRKPEPISIALADGLNKPFSNDEATILIREVKAHPEVNNTTIEVSLKKAGTAAGHDPDAPPARFEATPQQQIEVVDAKGGVMPSFPSSMRVESDSMRITMIVPSHGAQAGVTPTTLRYYSFVRVQTDVPFEFRDPQP